MRKKKGGTLLVTGGTGFLGSHLAVDLMKRGFRVIMLVRGSRQMRAEDRVARLLKWFAVDPPHKANLEVVEGDIEKPDLGLDRERYASLMDRIDEIIHAACNTSFAERKRAEIESVNVAGLRNVLALARDSTCVFFHHVSTAYVAGGRDGLCKEELVEQSRFTNVYEETKYRGERMVVDTCGREGIRHTIYRPSIVYGDSTTGRSIRFNAVYYPVRTLLFLKSLYEIDLRKRDGKKAAEMGVQVEKDGSLRLPIRVMVAEGGGLNLISIDYFVKAFAAVMQASLAGGVFHIVNDRPIKIEELIGYMERLFGVTGLALVTPGQVDHSPRNALETLFDGYVGVYAPYIRDTRTFECGKTARVLASRNIACPVFDFEIFSRCMRYAVEVDWGNKLFVGD